MGQIVHLKNFYRPKSLGTLWDEEICKNGPLAAILKFTQKCKQTDVSLKLSKVKKIFWHISSSHKVPKLLGR